MTIKSLTGRQCSNRHIARLLGVTEGTVRYHRRRQASGVADGRSGQQPVAAQFHVAIDAYVSASAEESPSNVAVLQRVGGVPASPRTRVHRLAPYIGANGSSTKRGCLGSTTRCPRSIRVATWPSSSAATTSETMTR